MAYIVDSLPHCAKVKEEGKLTSLIYPFTTRPKQDKNTKFYFVKYQETDSTK